MNTLGIGFTSQTRSFPERHQGQQWPSSKSARLHEITVSYELASFSGFGERASQIWETAYTFGVTFFHTDRPVGVLNGETGVALTGTTRLAVNMDESALIRAAQAGDQDAFERLVRGYDQSVLKLAYSLLRSADDAQDIYQEAFLRVHKNLHQFRFDCSFHTWLYRIVTNLCLDLMRKRKVRKEESSVVDTPDGPRDRAELTSDTRASMDPQRALVSGHLRQRIDSVLAELTARERMVFEMRHFEGMRLRAIGEVLGTSEEAAKNCLFRVTQKMRVALGDFV